MYGIIFSLIWIAMCVVWGLFFARVAFSGKPPKYATLLLAIAVPFIGGYCLTKGAAWS